MKYKQKGWKRGGGGIPGKGNYTNQSIGTTDKKQPIKRQKLSATAEEIS